MLDTLGLFAITVIGLLFVIAVCLVVWLGSLPASIARRRDHPQIDAINALSWLGLFLTGGIGWVLALVWALVRYDSVEPKITKSDAVKGTAANYIQLESRIAKLEQTLVDTSDSKGKS